MRIADMSKTNLSLFKKKKKIGFEQTKLCFNFTIINDFVSTSLMD